MILESKVSTWVTFQRQLLASETPVLHPGLKVTQEHRHAYEANQGKYCPCWLPLPCVASSFIYGHPFSSSHPETEPGSNQCGYALVLGMSSFFLKKRCSIVTPLKSMVRVRQETWCVFIPIFISLWLEILVIYSSMKLPSIDPFIQQIFTEYLPCSKHNARYWDLQINADDIYHASKLSPVLCAGLGYLML